MRILVTGAGGVIGRHLREGLCAHGHTVVCTVRRQDASLPRGVAALVADLTAPDIHAHLLASVRSIDAVYHLAALLPGGNTTAHAADAYLLANGVTTARILQAALSWGTQAFVYASSIGVIGRPVQTPITEAHPLQPLHPYHVGKLCGELACEQVRLAQGLRVTSLRFTSAYGPGMRQDSVLPLFIRKALASQDLTWYGSGERTQNFVHTADIVQALLKALDTKFPGVYNVGGPESISMRDLAQLVARLTPGYHGRVCPAGIPDAQDDFRWEVSCRKAQDYLGYRAGVSIEKGVGECMASLVATPHRGRMAD